jgi:ABC-type sugar transport system permease subunit
MVHKQTVGSQAESASAQPLPTRAKRSIWRRMWWNRSLYLLLAPVLAGMTLFQYYPALIAFYRSFFAWDGLRAHFIGLENFRFFFEDRRMATAWTNTTIILIFSTVVVLTMPLLTAYLIYSLRNDRHRYFFRVIFVLPLIVPSFVQIVLWRWVLSGNGAINMLLRTIGLGAITRPWLGDPDTALGASLFTGFPWIGGVTMLIYLAGFLAIPREILDAAEVDGASRLRRFWRIELPMIKGQIKLQVMLVFIGALQDFQNQLILTKGGPGYATIVPGLRMFDATMQQQLGYASAIGLVLFMAIACLTFAGQRFIRGDET